MKHQDTCDLCGEPAPDGLTCGDCGAVVCNLCIVMTDAGDHCVNCAKDDEDGNEETQDDG